MIDRTLNTIVKDVILKGIIVVYDDHSPTRNRKAAIEKMLLAGEFIASNESSIPAGSLAYLEKLQNRLAKSEPLVVTRWRDLITHPMNTYKNARNFKQTAGKLLDGAITASTKGKRQRLRKEADNTVQPIHGAETCRASRDGVMVPATLENTLTATASIRSAPLPAHLNAEVGGVGGPIAYVRFGDSDITVGPNTSAKIEFNSEAFTMVLVPNHSPGPAAVDPPAKTVRRTASVFTATGTARIVSQPQHTASDESSQDDGDDSLSVCMFEWLDGPVLTALTEDEGTTDSGSDTD